MSGFVLLAVSSATDSVNTLQNNRESIDIIIWFSFAVSVLFTLFAIYESYQRIFVKRKCTVLVTREVFFRLLEWGETLYTNLIFFSTDVSSVITNITGKLSFTNPATNTTKSFTLKLGSIGEKYRRSDGTSCFYFSNTSPLTYVVKDVPLYKTVTFELIDNSQKIKTLFSDFRVKAYQLLDELQLISQDDDPQNSESTTSRAREIEQEIEELIRETKPEVSSCLQIESGNYNLDIRLTYKLKSRILLRYKTLHAMNKISFEVGTNAKTDMIRKVDGYLRDVLILHNDRNAVINSPEYTPINISESSQLI